MRKEGQVPEKLEPGALCRAIWSGDPAVSSAAWRELGNAQVDAYPLVELKCMGPRAKRELRKELRSLGVKASRKR